MLLGLFYRLTFCLCTSTQHCSCSSFIQATSRAVKTPPAPHANVNPLTGKTQLAADPTPAKSLLADPGDTECIPDTPDEASASKAMHSSPPPAGVHDPAEQGITAREHAQLVLAYQPLAGALLPSATATSPSHLTAVAKARRMVPESPDEEGPSHLFSPHNTANPPESCSAMLEQEPAAASAPLVDQLPPGPASQSLHLSLGTRSTGAASHLLAVQPQAQPPVQPQAQPQAQLQAQSRPKSQAQPQAQPQTQLQAQPQAPPQAQAQAQPQAQPGAQPAEQLRPLADGPQNEAVLAQDTAVLAACGAVPAAAVPLSALLATAVHSPGLSSAAPGEAKPSDIATVAHGRVAGPDSESAAVASPRLAATAPDLEAAAVAAAVATHREAEAPADKAAVTHRDADAAADEAAMTHREADAAADEAAVTPSSRRQAHAQVVGSAGANTGSPMNDSALMAALDSAERKFMQVLDHTEYICAMSPPAYIFGCAYNAAAQCSCICWHQLPAQYVT